MAKKIKKKSKQEDDEEKPKKRKVQEYDTKRQPLWVTEPNWDHMFQLNGEGTDGQRAYLYGKKGFIVIANKDWEKDGDNLPGKSIRMKMDDLDKLMVAYMKRAYDYDIELKK